MCRIDDYLQQPTEQGIRDYMHTQQVPTALHNVVCGTLSNTQVSEG